MISGIHTFNFPEVFTKLRNINGVLEIDNKVENISEAVDFLLKNPHQATAIGQAGFAVLQENQGALTRHLQLLAPYIETDSKKV